MREEQINDLIELENDSINLEYINIILEDEQEFELAKETHSPHFYSSILKVIIHENYDENEAEDLFEGIIKHKKELLNTLKRDVGIVVAAMDYFTNIKNIINTPIIIPEEKSEFITQNSTIDGLTQLYLREIFDILLSKSIEEAKRNEHSLSLLIIDIDDFKNINDTQGHQKGDEILAGLGEIFNNNTRDMDFAARYGAEEFTVVLPETPLEKASKIANNLKKIVSSKNFTGINITISIGISTLNNNINTKEELIEYADRALYQAKSSGKNKVITEQDIILEK